MATEAPPVPTGEAFLQTLVRFARELRAEGLAVGTGDVLTYSDAATRLDPTDLVDLYWAGRVTLVTRADQLATYHRVFVRFFLGDGADGGPPRPHPPAARAEARAALAVPETELPPAGDPEPDREARLGYVASAAATLKGKRFGDCTPEELAALRRIMRTIRLTPPRRRTRRLHPHRRGRRPDLRRVVRETLRSQGTPTRLPALGRRERPRRLVLLLDVSGSMADYSRALLQFAHVTARSADRVEVFCFGTRLTRITRELVHRRPDTALDRAASAVVDWDGGTRIGECLDTFVRQWGRRGVARGGIVVVCSDGLDRGDPAVLAAAVERLSRQCHRLVWLDPHHAASGAPASLGLRVAAPYLDELLPAHDLAGLERFAALLPTLR